MEKKNVISGLALDSNIAKVGILKVPDQPGVAAKLFGALAKENINVDMIIQSIHAERNQADMAFTVNRTEIKKAVEVTNKIAKTLKAGGVISDPNVAKVSVVGVGMISQPGVAAKMFEALSDNNINIEMISTSEIKISCVIKLENGEKAMKILHDKFNLSKK